MNNLEQVEQMLRLTYQTLDDKQGEDIQVIDIREISVLTDYFVIVHGNNKSHVQSLVEYVTKAFSQANYPMVQHEGGTNSPWVLLDYGDMIIHIFMKEDREFYDLERVWSDAKNITNEIAKTKTD